MRWLAVTVLFFCLAPFMDLRQEPAQSRLEDERKIILRFQRSIDPKLLSIGFYLTGPFGGAGDFIRPAGNQWDYSFDPSYEGQAADSLKVIFYSPGYGFELIDIPSLKDLKERKIDVLFKPLPSRLIKGLIDLSKLPHNHETTLEVTFVAYWGNQFYGIADGMVPAYKVVTTTVGSDGSYSIDVPDFRHDPVVLRYKIPGVLAFRARDPKTGNFAYRLERIDHPDQRNEFQLSEETGTLNFIARPDH